MKQQPNILLITTDQQRFDTIAALGNPYIYTPHLNWLADEGVAFTRCYADCPICMPSRATIMTGRHGYSLGLTGNTGEDAPMLGLPTLPGLLTAAGYQTRAQGKMHFKPMRKNYGFEHMELPLEFFRQQNRNAAFGLAKQHGVGENETEPVISTADELHSLTHWTVQRSIDFLETRDDTRPFFLWTSFTKPHPPFDPSLNYWLLYQNREVPPPVYGDWSEALEQVPGGWMKPTYNLDSTYRFTPAQLADMRRAYYACITQVDYALGLLFARMREMGLLDTTWILFTSDHGDMLGDHHMGAKTHFLEGSAHVPLLIKPPFPARDGAEAVSPFASRRCDALVTLCDIMPTILACCGVAPPAACEGSDLLELLDAPRERTFYGSSQDRYFAVMEGAYKYTWTAYGGAELLFNLAADPMERRNLAADPAFSAERARLREKLQAHVARHNPELIENGGLKALPAPRTAADVPKWPGFHHTAFPSDVLH